MQVELTPETNLALHNVHSLYTKVKTHSRTFPYNTLYNAFQNFPPQHVKLIPKTFLYNTLNSFQKLSSTTRYKYKHNNSFQNFPLQHV